MAASQKEMEGRLTVVDEPLAPACSTLRSETQINSTDSEPCSERTGAHAGLGVRGGEVSVATAWEPAFGDPGRRWLCKPLSPNMPNPFPRSALIPEQPIPRATPGALYAQLS
ncbi:unnamed protein product [Prorocentrum cordatum]|uniref:Uncharacterized protein n=1 Tax=Prorocentrum cordatum TaxID=2364126 RepID=A0ABN9UZR7_9DINO|nr:unnamed protein product [Polarella glacialis]